MGGALSELQMGLLALGVAVVVGVFGFNKLQEIKHRKAGRGFVSGHEDVLLAERAKAVDPASIEAIGAMQVADRIEPHWEEPAAGGDPAPAVLRTVPAASTQPLAPPFLDERIDYIAEIEFASPLTGERAATLAAGFETARTLGCDGFNAAARAWEAPSAGSHTTAGGASVCHMRTSEREWPTCVTAAQRAPSASRCSALNVTSGQTKAHPAFLQGALKTRSADNSRDGRAQPQRRFQAQQGATGQP
jgi:hypothetical protein